MPKQERKDVPIGTKFNNLEVINNLYIKGVGYLEVKCTCGKTDIKRKWPIVSGNVKECIKCTERIRGEKRRKGYKDITGTILGKLRRNADARDWKIEVSPEFLYNLFKKQQGKCAISGLDISIEKTNRKNQCNASLDRIDSLKDYTEDNIQWVHKDVNRIKQNFNQEYFISLCKLISNKNE